MYKTQGLLLGCYVVHEGPQIARFSEQFYNLLNFQSHESWKNLNICMSQEKTNTGM